MGWKKTDTNTTIGIIITLTVIAGFFSFSHNITGSYFEDLFDSSMKLVEARGGVNPDLAFDGDLLTAWTGKPSKAYATQNVMAIVDFGKPTTIDTIKLDLDTDGYRSKYRVGLFGSISGNQYSSVGGNLETGYFTNEHEFVFHTGPIQTRYLKLVFDIEGYMEQFKIEEIQFSCESCNKN